jgi:hypothetical protein
MLDQVQDVNAAGLYQIYNEAEFPAFVKEGSGTTSEQAKDLPSASFAWEEARMFPVHTKVDTWLSCAYLQKFGSDIPADRRATIERTIGQACAFWGIEKPSLVEKTAAKEGYEITYPEPCNHTCLVSTPEELQKVAEDVLVPGRYPFGVRQTVARSVLGAPESLKQAMEPAIEVGLCKVACYGVGLVQDVVQALRIREIATEKSFPVLSEGLKEAAVLTKEAGDHDVVSGEFLGKMAAFVDAVDRFAGLHTRYSPGFQPPEQQFFRTTLRDFEDFSKHAVRLANGSYVNKEQLCSKPVVQFLETCFGQKCASEEDVVQVAKSLPSRKAQLLAEHLHTLEQA